MKSRSPDFKNLPLDMVGAADFGRYAKVNKENTYNMIISDNWLVPYAGFKLVASLNSQGFGRNIYRSVLTNTMYAVIGANVYQIQSNLSFQLIGTLNTSVGDVYIAEDLNGNVAIVDKLNLYMFNPATIPPFQVIPISFNPGYIAFQDTRFILTNINANEWRLSDPLAGNRSFLFDDQHVGEFQTKPDKPIAIVPFPGKGTMLFLIGSIVTQIWNDAGLPKFPYQLQSGVNIDYGTTNADTVSNIDNMVCWLGINDRSGPVILASDGSLPVHISTDGIDFKLNSLTNPQDAHGFMFKQDGHIFYQLTFPSDNLTLTYDFNTQKFFTVTDSLLNYHPAKKVAFFNNTYYFVSLNDGNLYEMSTKYTTYNDVIIPRIRITKTLRAPDTAPFICNNLSFPIEQGVDTSALNPQYFQTQELITEDDKLISTEYDKTQQTNPLILTTEQNYYSMLPLNPPPLPVVDLAISNDGGQTFGNFDRQTLNSLGNRKNRFIYYNLGWSNELTFQFRFYSFERIIVGNGLMSIYQ